MILILLQKARLFVHCVPVGGLLWHSCLQRLGRLPDCLYSNICARPCYGLGPQHNSGGVALARIYRQDQAVRLQIATVKLTIFGSSRSGSARGWLKCNTGKQWQVQWHDNMNEQQPLPGLHGQTTYLRMTAGKNPTQNNIVRKFNRKMTRSNVRPTHSPVMRTFVGFQMPSAMSNSLNGMAWLKRTAETTSRAEVETNQHICVAQGST